MAAERLLRRNELRALAFPIHAECAAKPRRTVVEALGGSRRVRHLAFLLQEATGLYRPLDWLKAAALWAAALVVALSLAGKRGGAGTHLLVALAPMGVLLAWGTARQVRLDRWQFLSAFGAYGLPVGHLELFWARVAALSVAYGVTGVLSAAALAVLAPVPDGCPSLAGLAAVNLAQFWLAGLALGALGSAAWGEKTTRGAFAALLAGIWFYAFLLLFFAGLLWGAPRSQGADLCGLGSGLRVAFGALWAAGTGESLSLVLESEWLGSPFRDVPGWPFDALGWWLLAVMVWVSLSLLWRTGRGRAHSRYRSHRPAGRPPAPFFRAGAAR
jgi:hypothetical protein